MIVEPTRAVDTVRPSDLDARRFDLGLAFVVVGAFVLRVWYVLAVTRHETAAYDNVYYQAVAQALGRGDGMIVPFQPGHPFAAVHPPLTVLVLAPTAWAFGGDPLAMRLQMALLGVVVVFAVACLARMVGGPRAGLYAGVIAAVYPNLWMNDGLLMSETLAALAVTVSLIALVHLVRSPGSWGSVLVGVACGLAMLTRAELVLLLPTTVVPAVLLARSVSMLDRIKLLLIAVLVSLAVVAPWVVHNLVAFERPVSLSTQDGKLLAGANCDATYYGPGLGFWSLGCAAATPKLGEASLDEAAAREAGIDYAVHHVERLPVVVTARIARVWSVYKPIPISPTGSSGEGRPIWAVKLGLVLYWLLVPLAVGGALILRRRGVPLAPLLGPFLLVTVGAALSYGITRLRVPAEVPLVVLAAVALARPWQDWPALHGLGARLARSLGHQGHAA